MLNVTRSLKPALALMLAMTLFACSSSRHQDGFSYIPVSAGPDMGAGEPEPAIASAPVTQPEVSMTSEDKPMTSSAYSERPGEQEILDLVETGVHEREQGVTDFRTNVRSMAADYAQKHDIRFSGKQLEKLDRISAKMEKKHMKQKGPDGGFGPSNNLEWAILGAAAVGLFVGIFGIGFGWLIFLVAALAYLYFKLLHKNN